jgi:SM-20-related protein
VPELNSELDRAQFAEAFRQTGRVHISDILTEVSARRLFRALEQETPWGLIYNEGKEAREFESVTADDHQEMAIAAWERAHSQFQYFYHLYRLLENRKVHPEPEHYLFKLVRFLTSPQFLQFAREVTGDDSIGWISATATLYKPLDFLTVHDDGLSRRRIAYVLNMTPEWRPDWGGALQFYDRDDHIEEGYLPTFNALNLFRVPRRHSVAQISSFGGLRYSISGWLEPALGAAAAGDQPT